MDKKHRRDAYCGKISICNNLRQANINFTNTLKHVEEPNSEALGKDLEKFKRVCRTVEGLKSVRLGVVGIRPNPFQTVRFSERVLESRGISVEVSSLMSTVREAESLDENDSSVQKFSENLKEYFDLDLPEESLLKTAKLEAVLSDLAEEKDLNAISFQCWPEIEEDFGICPCGSLSLMSEHMTPPPVNRTSWALFLCTLSSLPQVVPPL